MTGGPSSEPVYHQSFVTVLSKLYRSCASSSSSHCSVCCWMFLGLFEASEGPRGRVSLDQGVSLALGWDLIAN